MIVDTQLIIKQVGGEETHFLRQKILRPHQPLVEMAYPNDGWQGAFHLAAYYKEHQVGIASFYPECPAGLFSADTWRLRGMAVVDEMRGQSLGKKLIENGRLILEAKQAHTLWCNARTSAIGFYLKLGFERQGEEFQIEGIGPHFKAHLKLRKSTT